MQDIITVEPLRWRAQCAHGEHPWRAALGAARYPCISPFWTAGASAKLRTSDDG